MHKIIFLVAYLLTNTLISQDVKEIIRQADKKMRGNSSKANMTMTIVRPDWSRKISIKSWSYGDEHSLILIAAPARDKGTAFLKREKEIWNWQPKIERVIKLPPSMMMQSWMGSDFTNDDLVKESSIVKDYDHKLLSDTIINDYVCYKIELLPYEDAAVVWGKIIVYIEKEEFLQLLIKYFDEDGFLVNTMALSEIKKMDGRVIPTLLEMIPTDEPGNKTVIKYEDLKFNIDIEASFFSIRNLKQIRP